MTVITYSSAAGRLLKEIQVLEHPSTSRNVPEPLSEVLKPQTMLDPMEDLIQESCGVKGQRWIEQRDDKRGAKREEVKKRRQTRGRGVSRERIDRGRRDEQHNFRNKCNKKVRKDLKSGRECLEERHKRREGVFGIRSAAEEVESKQKEERMEKLRRWSVFPCPFHLKNITEGEVKRAQNVMKRMRWHRIFLWLILLLFSLCPKPASSQVRVALNKKILTSDPKTVQ